MGARNAVGSAAMRASGTERSSDAEAHAAGSAIGFVGIVRRERRPLARRTLSKLDHDLFDRWCIPAKRRGDGIAPLFEERDGVLRRQDHADSPRQSVTGVVVASALQRVDTAPATAAPTAAASASSSNATALRILRLYSAHVASGTARA